ncbi:ATP-binding SpoIIE family protein phosphatase [Streptomyces sp. NPDC046821]|uniref:ATP-binding SpoIIE family protein phosphatase n=1 Tax=Streptomyces sp. NPDC046821 TaxID=3154702 RepID=UPI0033D84D0A
MIPLPARAAEFVCSKELPANQLAAAGARRFLRAALSGDMPATAKPATAKPATAKPAGEEPQATPGPVRQDLVDNAVLLASELVTNAVVYAGTDITVVCRLEQHPDTGVAVVVEVADRHPSRRVRGGTDARRGEPGYGLQLVSALSQAWGVTYRRSEKRVWFRLEASAMEASATTGSTGPGSMELGSNGAEADAEVDAEADATAHRADQTTGPGMERVRSHHVRPSALRHSPGSAADWVDRSGPAFLAETSELLAGQLDQGMVTALAAQLLVPRLADWCGIWLRTHKSGLQLSRVWHVDERRIVPLREELERVPPSAGIRAGGTPWPWPESGGPAGSGGSAFAFPLSVRDTDVGVLLLGRAGQLQMTDAVVRMLDDVARRVAQAVITARQYTKQTTISVALQRRQLPPTLASIAGVDTAIVYEPHGEGQTVGGDFYDVFPMGAGRWCFLLGDVQGKDPEAMSVTGLARHLVRLLAREGHGVESVLDRLNIAMAEESAEALEAHGEQAAARFLSLLYGELTVDPRIAGARCRVASAGHPLPLHLFTDGRVEPACEPQMLLGIDEGTEFGATGFHLAPGETLLCVTDGVTERRNGNWQLDDDDGLADVLRLGLGLGAKALAEHVRRAAHDFGTGPVEDDLSILVLQARTADDATRPTRP